MTQQNSVRRQDRRKAAHAFSARRIALRGVLLALALALSRLEGCISLDRIVPLPGARLGLGNIASLAALYLMDIPSALALSVLRSLLGAFFGGGLTGLAFSLAGGLLSILTMAAAMRARFFSIYGVSLLGAASHNIGQIGVAVALTGTVHIAAYLPFLLGVGLATGLATGSMCAGVLRAFAVMRRREGL